jgi:methylthioribose-1-phosphate isomerase
MSKSTGDTVPLRWQDDRLVLLDQTRLPHEVAYVHCRSAEDVCTAIRTMVVRGAPAIGIAAAYGVALAARGRFAEAGERWREAMQADVDLLAASRPTAVNLSWALAVMRERIEDIAADPYPVLLARAQALHRADVASNEALGEFGARLIAPRSGVLTHCNAGALATGGYGTALGVIRSAWRAGRLSEVFVTETRPWLQGARLTAWELDRDGIAPILIADNAAAYLMQQGRVDWVITGADRIAANGDTANKIGTYALATLARAHGVKFMVAAPLSTIDRSTPSGAGIPIEHRDDSELTHLGGHPVAAAGVRVLNPVFDVTPALLIDALATEKGVVEKPDKAAIAGLFDR